MFKFKRYKNATGRPDSYEEALLNFMMILTTIRLPLYEDLTKMYKWKQHFTELDKLNITDFLFKVVYQYLRVRTKAEILIKIAFH